MRTKVNYRALSLSAGQANSFICLIEIQAKHVFFRLFASAIGEIFVFSMILKPHFCSTLIDPMLSVAALAKIGRSTTRWSILLSASVANPLLAHRLDAFIRHSLIE